MQHRTNPLQKCQLKFSNKDAGEFQGYASVFDSNDQINDTIKPGAFKQSLQKGLPKMFINHDHSAIPVGDWLDMKEDKTGLFATGRIDMNHRDGLTAYSALKRGAMDGMSIGFQMNAGDYEAKEDGGRLIKNVELFEVSIVNFPMESGARISDVKFEDLTSLKDWEGYLRDAEGLSRSVAKALISQIKHIACRDDESVLKDQIIRQQETIESLRSHIGKLNADALIHRLKG